MDEVEKKGAVDACIGMQATSLEMDPSDVLYHFWGTKNATHDMTLMRGITGDVIDKRYFSAHG